MNRRAERTEQPQVASYREFFGGSVRISKNYKKMVDMYKHFARHLEQLDWSEEALEVMYTSESFGSPPPSEVPESNGYKQGKKWMDVTVSMWKEDFGSTLFVRELYEDSTYPHWWLDKVVFKDRDKDLDLIREQYGHK